MIFRSGYERFDILTDQRRERAPYPGVNRPGLSESSGLLLAFETGDLPQAQCGESGDPIPSSLATSGILRSRSSTSSIARRRSSSEYFLGLAMTQSPSPGPKAKERALHETRDGSSSPTFRVPFARGEDTVRTLVGSVGPTGFEPVTSRV